MKQAIILIGIMAIMAMTTFGIQAGDIFTQAQLDAQDMDTINLPFNYVSASHNGNYIFVTNAILNIEAKKDGTYLVVEQNITIASISVPNYIYCKTIMSNSDCNMFAILAYRFNKGRKEQALRRDLKAKQTQPDPGINVIFS